MQEGRRPVRNPTCQPSVEHQQRSTGIESDKDSRRARTAAMNSLPAILALSFLVSAVNELALLSYPATARANEIATIDGNAGWGEIELFRVSLTLVRVVSVTSEGETLGMIAIYDDPMTLRPKDYLELRDNDGYVVAAEWFDSFGIRRLTLDRGFLSGGGRFEHIFVTLVSGESI